MATKVHEVDDIKHLGTRQRKKLFLEKFPEKFFNVTLTCQAIGIDRKTYYKWINKDSKFREAVKDLKEQYLDLCEAVLAKKVLIKDDPLWAYRTLERLGKDRGWAPKQEVEHSGEVNNILKVEIIEVHKKEK